MISPSLTSFVDKNYFILIENINKLQNIVRLIFGRALSLT